MAGSGRGKRQRRKRRPSGISNIPQKVPDVTNAPDSTDPFSAQSEDSDSTNVEDIGVPERAEYVASGPALLDKFLHGRVPLPPRPVFVLLTLGWFGFLSWLFIQENSTGRIENWAGRANLGIKALIYTGYSVIVAVIVTLILKFARPPTSSSDLKE